MNFLPYVFLALGCVGLVLYITARIKTPSPLAVLFKALASVAFMAIAATAVLITADIRYGIPVLMGLLFGLIGDITLEVMVVYPKDTYPWRMGGMISFFVGHLVYITGLFFNTPFVENMLWKALVPAAIALAFTVIHRFAAAKMGLAFGRYKVIAVLYSFLLAFFTSASGVIMCLSGGEAAAGIPGFSPRWVILFIGTVLFILSDVVLAQQYFGAEKNLRSPVLITINSALYYFAQFAIAFSVLAV
jgi:hypothetical protein